MGYLLIEMLNSENIEYLPVKTVLNIEAERLYRLAEDEFFHFEEPKKALKLVGKALNLSPNFLKALILKADIFLFENKIVKAFDIYQKAVELNPQNVRALASFAACLDMRGEYFSALKHCNLAFEQITLAQMNLYPSLYELKFNLLIKLRKFDEAKYLLNNSVYDLTSEEANFLRACNQSFLKKRIGLLNKIKEFDLRVI